MISKKRVVTISILFIMAVFFFSGCDITSDDTEEGILKIINNSTFGIWVEVESDLTNLNPNEYVEYIWDLDPDEIIQVNVEYGITGGNPISTSIEVEAGYLSTYTVEESEGELRVTNNSSRDVWYALDGGNENQLTSGVMEEWTYELLEYELFNTEIYYYGYHVFTNTSTEAIMDGSTTNFVIEADAGGIELHNDMYNTDIVEVYLSPSGSSWGEDDLGGVLYPGHYVTWTVSAGSWDIRAIDESGSEYTSFYNIINLDETSEFYIDGWEKSAKGNHTKSRKSFPPSSTEDKVELRAPNSSQ